MTERQRIFAREYIACGNASEAYRRAYPAAKRWKPDVATHHASAMLKRGHVQAMVSNLRKKIEDARTMTLQEANHILTDMGRGKIQDYLDESGRIDPAKIAQGTAAVVEFSETPTKHGLSRRLKVDPKAAISLIGDHLGWKKPQQMELVDGTELAKERAMFEAMSPEERAAWLDRQQSAE